MREVREGLTMLINGTPGFRCTGSHRTMEDALSRLDSGQCDAILTDIGLPGMSGIEGIRILRERLPELPILALTGNLESDNRPVEALARRGFKKFPGRVITEVAGQNFGGNASH